MGFERHLFISYAHIDNQPLTPEHQGWITRFHQSLEAILSMRIGQKAVIWRDDKLQGNDVFADEIIDQFDHTALLISVLTPRYVNSQWCTREVSEFCRKAERNGGLVVENKSRVFKVLKTPVDSQDLLPAVVKNMLGYEFFTMEDGAPLELDPAYGEKFAHDYNRKVGVLAWDAAQLIKKLESASENPEKSYDELSGAKETVYLAECSHDLRDAREILETDLRFHGYEVLPVQRLPLDNEENYVESLKHMLSRCKVSIHLIGSSYGFVPDGPNQKSTAVIQNEVAALHCKNSPLQRIIWLPENTQPEPAQQKFIQALHEEDNAQFGADLITGDIEELKSAIHGTLKILKNSASAKQETRQVDKYSSKLIYLICVAEDRKATIPLRKFLKSKEYEVAIPAFEGKAGAVREAHHKLLKDCEVIIVFYGAGDEAWKRTTDNELKKIKIYRGKKPLLAKYTYLALPKTVDKEDLIELEEPNIVNGINGFSETLWNDFFRHLNSDKRNK